MHLNTTTSSFEPSARESAGLLHMTHCLVQGETPCWTSAQRWSNEPRTSCTRMWLVVFNRVWKEILQVLFMHTNTKLVLLTWTDIYMEVRRKPEGEKSIWRSRRGVWYIPLHSCMSLASPSWAALCPWTGRKGPVYIQRDVVRLRAHYIHKNGVWGWKNVFGMVKLSLICRGILRCSLSVYVHVFY